MALSVINDGSITGKTAITFQPYISTIAFKIKVPLDMVWDAVEQIADLNKIFTYGTVCVNSTGDGSLCSPV